MANNIVKLDGKLLSIGISIIPISPEVMNYAVLKLWPFGNIVCPSQMWSLETLKKLNNYLCKYLLLWHMLSALAANTFNFAVKNKFDGINI